MRLKCLIFAMLLLITAGLAACGSSESNGLNGAITVSAGATGSVVNATATYTNPTETNLIGVPIEFTVVVGNTAYDLGEYHTNNSGTVGIAFPVPAFNGTQTVTVVARSAKLTDFETFQMAGRSLIINAPASLNLTTSEPTGTAVPFSIDALTAFVTVTDPFGNDLGSHPIDVSADVSSTDSGDTLTPKTFSTATGSGGVAPFPGAQGTLKVPALGAVESMTITWTVTDTVTNQSGSAITTVKLTKTE